MPLVPLPLPLEDELQRILTHMHNSPPDFLQQLATSALQHSIHLQTNLPTFLQIQPTEDRADIANAVKDQIAFSKAAWAFLTVLARSKNKDKAQTQAQAQAQPPTPPTPTPTPSEPEDPDLYDLRDYNDQ